MTNPDLKNATSTLRDTGSKMSEAKDKLAHDAPPRVRDAMNQVSETASDLYERASNWLNEGNHRDYGFVALALTAGVVGFIVGRGMRSSSEF